MKRYIKTLGIIFFVFCPTNFAQNSSQDKIIALIGDKPIYESEFIERFEFTPIQKKQIKKLIPELKLEFLYTLIAEKIWAKYAAENNFDTTEAIRYAEKSIEKMYLRDALFNKEVREKIVIDNKMVNTGMERFNNRPVIRFITSLDSTEIFNLYELLKSGANFDTLLSTRPEFKEQTEPQSIKFGALQDYVEEQVYKLKSKQFTAPIAAPDGWYIFYVYNIKRQLAANSKETTTQLEEIQKIIEDRETQKNYDTFVRSFFTGKKVDANSRLFNLLASELEKVFKEKETMRQIDSSGLYNLNQLDVIKIESDIKNDLSSPFITIEGKEISLKEFFRDFAFDGLALEAVDKLSIYNSLNNRVKRFIEYELLADEAFRRGLQYTPEVTNAVRMWRDNYLAQAVKANTIEQVQVSDSAVKEYYSKLYKKTEIPVQVNIIEIFTDKLEEANRVLLDARNGVDFRLLADKFNKREWTKKSHGEYGYFPVNTFGEIGKAASSMEIGDIFGPIKNDGGYSVIKLIDKKKKEFLPETKSFDEVKEDLKRKIAVEKVTNGIINKTAKLASEYGITINRDALNAAEVTTINSFAMRIMGFGGKITAVPLVSPETDWVDIWLKKKEPLP
ncbi:MAG: peptidyl-prolyl cis-trans isomerase [Melioribacteraceae bacterium]|nr:peptidyl-prolyl cis-trans isomerase [Melioribacteraceae bacterium]